MLLISTKALSQGNNNRAIWNLRIKQALHMKDNEFNSFVKETEKYDNRINDIMRDSTIAKNNKMVEIDKVLSERRSYVKEHLSEDQLKTLLALEKQRATEKGSRYQQLKKEQEERMKKRALNRRPDSTHVKQPAGQ
jgi:hypothetical protein